MKKQIKASETRVIKRSQIKLNPLNPKRHTEEAIKRQKKNFQKVGFLGGIVWNEVTGNLIDGHRRIYGMDLYYGYDGTPDTDYQVKVEVTSLDEKTEKEQLTYMAVGNTKADIDLIAKYANDIDITDMGLDNNEMKDIFALTEKDMGNISDDFDSLIQPIGEEAEKTDSSKLQKDEKTPEEKKAHVKDVKEKTREMAEERQQNENAYITLSFSDYKAKRAFCELMNIGEEEKYAKGEDVLKLID